MGTSKVQVFCRRAGDATLERRVERTKFPPIVQDAIRRVVSLREGAGFSQGRVMEGTFREEKVEDIGIW